MCYCLCIFLILLALSYNLPDAHEPHQRWGGGAYKQCKDVFQFETFPYIMMAMNSQFNLLLRK